MSKSCIYLTVAQIDALHDLAHRTDIRYGTIQNGVQIETDDHEKSHVSLVASFTEIGSVSYSDNSFAEITKDGLTSHWER